MKKILVDRVVILIRGKSVCCDTLENVMAGQPLEDRFLNCMKIWRVRQMNNIFTIMKKELFRYFSDRRMLLTTILLPGLMIYIVYSIMGQAMSTSLRSEDDSALGIYDRASSEPILTA